MAWPEILRPDNITMGNYFQAQEVIVALNVHCTNAAAKQLLQGVSYENVILCYCHVVMFCFVFNTRRHIVTAVKGQGS